VKVVFSEDQIQQRVQEIARDVSRDYGDEAFHAVGILEGGFMFLADLVRRVTAPVVCQFVKMEMADSQEAGHQPLRRIVYGSPGDVKGQHVLLVDAMVDSGVPLDYLVQQMRARQPRSVRVAALVNREEHRRVDLPLVYAGFSWTSRTGERLIGYGMGRDGMFRNLPYVAAVTPDGAHGEKQRGRQGR
jgi:hypoxanthine phosphoribosyltransferase